MNKNLLKLEYDKIINILSNYCVTYIGKDFCHNLLPSTKTLTVQCLLSQTSEATIFIDNYGTPPISEISNMDIAIKSLESNISLSPKALLEIAHILKISRELKTYFIGEQHDSNNEINFPNMYSIFELLYVNIGIEKTIFDSIIDESNIADNASKVLSNLRRNRKNLESSIKDKLNTFIHSSNYSKYIMEPIITIRNDRYVIPVKVEYKDNIKGFIHDISFSGSTVFIEPISIFDINNQINNIKAEENIEIERILQNLSNILIPISNNLKSNIKCIGEIDFCFAKAKYSNTICGIEPTINTDKFINLIGARHPLIDSASVVPISLNLGSNFNSLIITGPNTGGKTVTLKTVGLLCLMACSGLHIPAKETSSIFVFDNIFADIGDEQSIAESLSTFSSHMINIIEILKNATEKSLILVDELGSGTDPVQGASLAISILENLYNRGSLTLSTTHYSELKNYALATDGFENASSEFDIENLKPTYKLIIGVPGKSNAFAISKRLGLSDEILKRAEHFIDSTDVSIEELIKNIYDDKLIIEKEKEEILKKSNQIDLLKKSLERDVSSLESQRNDIIEKAKFKSKEILLSAKEDADEIIRDLNKLYSDASIKDSLKTANNIRNDLNLKLKNDASNDTITVNPVSTSVTADNINIGDTVFVPSLNSDATIVSRPNKSNDVQIQLGNAIMKININKLEPSKIVLKPVQTNLHSTVRTVSKVSSNCKAKTISPEINVIGQNVDDAVFVIDKYLDDCYMSNLNNVRIVHGKGTGKLRAGIHTFLKKHPHVKSFRLGTFGEGEMGVTVVEL